MYNQDYLLQKQEQLNKNAGILFSCLWIMTLLFFIQEPVIRSSTLGVVIWLPSVVVLFIYSLNVFQKISSRDFLIFFFAFAQLIVICVATQIWKNKTMLFAMLRYMTLLVSVVFCSFVRIDKKVFDAIFVVSVIIACLLLIYSFTPIATRYDSSKYAEYNYVPDYFVYNFSNPNAAAFYILGIYSIILVNLPYRKHRMLLVGLLLACVWMIFKTDCRSGLIVAVVITVIFLFFSNNWIPNWIAVLCIFLPLIFVSVYLYLYLKSDGRDVLFLGKSLFSGREDVYDSYINYIRTPMHFLFGNFQRAKLANAHNAPLTIFASFGLYGLICFYMVMIPVVFRIKTFQKSRITTASVACLLGFFVTSCTEAIAFLGTFPGIIFLNSFILMANFKEPLPKDLHPEIVNMVKTSKMLQRVKNRDSGGEK